MYTYILSFSLSIGKQALKSQELGQNRKKGDGGDGDSSVRTLGGYSKDAGQGEYKGKNADLAQSNKGYNIVSL